MPLSSSLLLDSTRIKIIKKQKEDSKFYYDIHTKVPTTQNGGTFSNAGTNVVFDITRKAIIKNVVKSEWYGGDVTASQYRSIREDVNSSLTN